jgi:hypothetical protein
MGWMERMAVGLRLNTGRSFRPALAGALALVLIVGGGSFVQMTSIPKPSVQPSATVRDLQILDRNDSAFQALDTLQQNDSAQPAKGQDAATQPAS